jgi:eukaryotic-like serine/threonine-protein kinase
MNLVPATRLRPYEMVAPLGAGAMGEVYRAKDIRLDCAVVVRATAQRATSPSILTANETVEG